MPKKKQDDFYDLEALLSENKINKKELLSTIIDALQKFCQDNILSLHPLCDETGTDTRAHFVFFHDIQHFRRC